MKLVFTILPIFIALGTVQSDDKFKRDVTDAALLTTLRGIERILKFGPCPSGWTYFKGYCYLVSNSIKTWHQAQAYCKGLGGDLVKINSEEENEFVLKLVNKRAPSLSQVWLALEWNPQRKAFIWADNSIPTFRKWFAGEPNGNAHEPCSNFWTRHPHPGINGYWNDLSCWNQNVPCGIVCKRLP